MKSSFIWSSEKSEEEEEEEKMTNGHQDIDRWSAKLSRVIMIAMIAIEDRDGDKNANEKTKDGEKNIY